MTRDLSCIGCGYCCSVRLCDAGQRAYNATIPPCPGLIWDEEAHRHWCKLAKLPGDLGFRYREELAIGTACSSSLFNDWRENVKDRTGAVEKKYKMVKLDKYFKVFLHAVSKQWMSGDLKNLIVMMWSRELIEAGVDPVTVEAMVREVHHIFKEGQPSYLKDFMG